MLWSEIQINREVIPKAENMAIEDFIYYIVGRPGKIIGYSVHLTEKFPQNNYVICELPANEAWRNIFGTKKLEVRLKPEDLRLE